MFSRPTSFSTLQSPSASASYGRELDGLEHDPRLAALADKLGDLLGQHRLDEARSKYWLRGRDFPLERPLLELLREHLHVGAVSIDEALIHVGGDAEKLEAEVSRLIETGCLVREQDRLSVTQWGLHVACEYIAYGYRPEPPPPPPREQSLAVLEEVLAIRVDELALDPRDEEALNSVEVIIEQANELGDKDLAERAASLRRSTVA